MVVGDGSDVGGGSSIMGTLSGGGSEVISIGERCLLGANAGIGISLGDDCTVEAGPLRHRRARWSRCPTARSSRAATSATPTACCSAATRKTGTVEALPRSGNWAGLNAALHAND